MPTLGEWDSWLERSKAKFAPYEVPEEEREQVLSEGEVGQYPGDNPEPFLKSGRKEFSKLKADRLALTDQVNKARAKEKELHPYPKLERAFSAVTGSVPSFLSPDVPAPDIPAQPTPDAVVAHAQRPMPESPQTQRAPSISSSAQQVPLSDSPPLGTRQDNRFGVRPVPPLDVRGMQRTMQKKSADLTRRRKELDDLQGQLDKLNPQFQIRTGQYPTLTDEEREQYDVTRNVFNQKAQEFNAQRDEYNRLTKQFNKKIDARERQQVTPQIRPTIDRFGSSMDFGTPDTVVQNQPAATPKPRSFGEALTLATNNLFQGAAGIPADILKSIAIASKDVDAWLPEALKDKRPVEDRLTYKMGQAVERVAKRAFPSDPESQKEFIVGVLPQAVGSMAAFMTGGLAGAATKSPALVGGAISSLMGAGAQGTQQYEEAKSFGADEPTQRKAFWLGSAVGSSESLPIAGLLNRFNKATGGGFFKVLKESGVTAAQEFIQEWGQQVGSNAIAKELYDENRGLLEGAGISGAAGGVTGAVTGLLSGVIAGRKIRKQQQAHEGKATESPFVEESPLRTTPLRMPSPAQPSIQQTVPLSPSPHDLIASIPSELTVSQRPPFLIKQQPLQAPQPVPTPESVMLSHPQQVAPPVMVTPETGPEPMPLPPVPALEPLPSPIAPPERTMAPEPEAAIQPVERFNKDSISQLWDSAADVVNRNYHDLKKAQYPIDDYMSGDMSADEFMEIAQTFPPSNSGDMIQKFRDLVFAESELSDLRKAHGNISETIDITPRTEPNTADTPPEVLAQFSQQREAAAREEAALNRRAQEELTKEWAEKPTVSDIHRLADSKGIPWDNDPAFADLTEEVTGKRHLDDLTGQERQRMVEALHALSSVDNQQVPTHDTAIDAKAQAANTAPSEGLRDRGKDNFVEPASVGNANFTSNSTTVGKDRERPEKKNAQPVPTPDDMHPPHAETNLAQPETIPVPGEFEGNPLIQQPRSALSPEQNTEMMLRAEKAQADMEIAGKERGGLTFIEQDGHGSTPETIGFKSATADWYKKLTTGKRPLKRAQIETAIQKIIKDHGVDVGVAVERVKEAILRDSEFNRTPWGEDAAAIARGEWPIWVEKPGLHDVPTPEEARKNQQVEEPSQPETPPTPDLVLTAPTAKPVKPKIPGTTPDTVVSKPTQPRENQALPVDPAKLAFAKKGSAVGFDRHGNTITMGYLAPSKSYTVEVATPTGTLVSSKRFATELDARRDAASQIDRDQTRKLAWWPVDGLVGKYTTAKPSPDSASMKQKESLQELIARNKPGNPFARKAARERLKYEAMIRPTARDKAMEHTFPLGAGFGHAGDARRLDAWIDRAVEAGQHGKNAKYFESQAEAFDRGEINAQGRAISKESLKRSEQRNARQQARQERIDKAKEIRGDKPQWQVPAGIWADSSGYLGGSARDLVLSEHRSAVEQALDEGKPVPPEVLADYPDLQPQPTPDQVVSPTKPTPATPDTVMAHGKEPSSIPAPHDVTAGRRTIEQHKAFMRRLYDGQVSIEEYKRAFQSLRDSKESLTAELQAMSKEELIKLVGGRASRSDKKESLVRQGYDSLLSDFAINRGVSYMLTGKPDGYSRALSDLVGNTTEADLKKFIEDVAKRRAERKARIEGVQNPQTLEDFDLRVRVKGEASLSPEQQARYDELLAKAGREKRKQAQEQNAVVQGVDAGTDVQLVESKHTKTGEPLFVVKLGTRVDRAVYDRLNQAAHQLGGRYSSYNKDGAVPGFTFKSKESAESFMSAAKGETVSSSPVKEAVRTQVQNNAVANLREMADRLDANADEVLSTDRKTNTARRARMASHTENAAHGDKALANTMRNLAEAIESGDATHLGGLRTKAQVEMMNAMLERAKADRDRTRFKDYAEQEKHKGRKVEPEDAAFAEFPDFDLLKDHVQNVIRDLTPIKGTERIRNQLTKAMNQAGGNEQVHIDRELAESAMDKYPQYGSMKPPWQWTEALAKLKRLEAMGITSLPELRAALREFSKYRGTRGTIDKATRLERNLIGNKGIGNDFFPTPKATADRMVREADIQPGMKVLEPSAGNGNIAEVINAAGVNPDVVESSSSLREILESKGFNVVGHDFMDVTEGGYDRIVMNPPFSNGQDADHIRHAYSLLKPGGKLVAIAGEGIFSRNDAKATAFRNWLDEQGGTSERLPEGTFKDTSLMATTGANARMISLAKPIDVRSVGASPHEVMASRKSVSQAPTPDAIPNEVRQSPTPDNIVELSKPDDQRRTSERVGKKPAQSETASTRRIKGIPREADPPVASYQNNDTVKVHKDYGAAKSGDGEAAIRLVNDLVKPETVEEVKKRFPGRIFIAPLAQEASGMNAIPKALAAYYADASGGMTDSRVRQVNKAFHTGADPMERIMARPRFEGPVTPGGQYVLVDDVTTLGGTLAELAHHIQQGGGKVVGIVTLANASRSGKLSSSKQHVRLIEERFGHELREEYGIDPEALTGPEAGYLVGFRDADELRTRSARAKEQRARRLAARKISKPQDPSVAAQRSDSNITELSAPDRSASSEQNAEPSSSAKELADLFKQESEHAKKAVRPTQPRIPVAPIMGGTSKPLGEIVLDLEKGTGKKIVVGKTKPGVAGVYKPGSGATIIKYSGDLDTTAHELSHALDDQYGLVKEWKGQDTSPFDAELEPFSQHGSSDPNASPTYNRAEGVAEYLRAWMVNPDAAEAAAPQFTAHVKAKLPTDIQKALQAFSTQIRQWYGNTAHAKIMANVQWETPETGLTQWLAGSRTARGPGFQLTFGDQMATAWTDRLAPFMRALKYAREQRGLDQEQVLPGDDPALLSRLFMGVNAKLDDIFAHGMVNSRLERATPGGLPWMIEPLDRTSAQSLDADMQEVATLMIAQRTLEKEQQLGRPGISGIGAGLEEDAKVARDRVEELKKDPARYAKLQEAASRYRQWADANLRYLVDKGRLSQEQYEGIKDNNEQYVAMQRILEVSPGEELAAFMPHGTPSRKIGAVGTPVHSFKGSRKAIKNPYLSLMDATHRSIREADRNEIMKLFRDLLTTDRGLYEGVPNNLASVGREAQAGEQQTIPIFVNGKKEIWQFHPDVYKALKGIEDGTYTLPPFLTILPRILRATIVNTPAFALRNVIRDAWQRSIASLSGSKPWDTLKVYSKEEISQLKRSGGDQAGHYYTDSKNYARAMKFAMQEAVASHNSIVVNPAKLATWVKQGGQGYLDLMQGSERQGRLSEYRRAFRKAQQQFGYDDYHAMLYAASQSRGLIDYAIAGNTMALLNQLIPFSNAAVQGLRSNLLRAKADPAGFALRFGVFALVPALMNYAWNYLYDDDDLDEYRQLPAYQRDLFWNFKLGPDLWLKVPKPFELGVMASSFERMLDYSTGNTKAFDGHVGAFLRTLLPVDDASLAGPYQSWLQAATNYDFFRDRPIVPRWEENLALDLRNYHRASRLGQALQQAVGVDARKIDFLLQSQFGYVGRYAVDLSDTGRKDRHGLTLSASGVTGGSPASVSLDAKEVSRIAEERGVVPSRSKAVDRITNMTQITPRTAKHPDSLRYAVFRKHLNEYYKAESREDRDRLAKQVRADAKYLRDLWEKQPPRPEADEKIKKKRELESEYDPFLDLMGFPQPLSKRPTTALHELVP